MMIIGFSHFGLFQAISQTIDSTIGEATGFTLTEKGVILLFLPFIAPILWVFFSIRL